MASRGARFFPALDPDIRRARRLEVSVRRPPRLGARIPSFIVRVALGVICIALVFIQLPGAFWITVGILLAILAGLAPRSHAAWLVILLLGASEGLRGIANGEWRFFVLLAGIHAIAILGSLTLALPSRGMVQLRVLGHPALRYLIVQIIVQAVAVVILSLTGPSGKGFHASAPVLAVVAACGFIALVALLVAPLLRSQPRG
jgi:hypothetical protein